MQVSAHFPTNAMNKGLKKLDFPFVLAHLWNRAEYRKHLDRYRNVFAIVDNGVHENGQPLPVDRIASVLDLNPGWIGILPDMIHKPVWTWTRVVKTMVQTGLDPSHWGVVLHGNQPEQIHFQHDLAVELGFGLICFPYKANRWTYLKPTIIDFRYNQRYHLMGLNEKDDLRRYATLPGKWSLDSMKIWKLDLRQANWHGHKVDFEYYDVDWSLVDSNLEYLGERFYGGSAQRLSQIP